MVTGSVATALLAISLPPALLIILARRSKRSENIRVCKSTNRSSNNNSNEAGGETQIISVSRTRLVGLSAPVPVRPGLSSCDYPRVVATFACLLIGYTAVAATTATAAVITIPSRIGFCTTSAFSYKMMMTYPPREPAAFRSKTRNCCLRPPQPPARCWYTTTVTMKSISTGTDGASQRRAAYLPGKTVWITGASSGLGEQLAISAAAGGASGLILSGRREDALERVKRACEDAARSNATDAGAVAALRVELLPFDVADLEFAEKEAAMRAVQLFGRIDALVLNAGISTRGSVEDTPLEVDKRVMAVNYFGPVGLAKGLLRAIGSSSSAHTPATTEAGSSVAGETGAEALVGTKGKEAAAMPATGSRGGVQFVVINSVQGKFGIAFRSSYAASKHALLGFFDCFRAEHAHQGVGVLNVFPGYVRTSLSVNALTADGTKHAQMDETTARGRDPREVADQVWQAVADQREEVVIADLKTNVAVLLRALAPRTLFGIMAKRALKAGAGGGSR